MKKRMIITAAVVVFGLSVPTGVFAEDHVQTNVITQQQEVTYEQMNVEDLPEPVTKSVTEGYADYTLSEAYMGTDGSYKVVLEKENEKIAVFFNEQGEFLKIEAAEDPVQ